MEIILTNNIDSIFKFITLFVSLEYIEVDDEIFCNRSKKVNSNILARCDEDIPCNTYDMMLCTFRRKTHKNSDKFIYHFKISEDYTGDLNMDTKIICKYPIKLSPKFNTITYHNNCDHTKYYLSNIYDDNLLINSFTIYELTLKMFNIYQKKFKDRYRVNIQFDYDKKNFNVLINT